MEYVSRESSIAEQELLAAVAFCSGRSSASLDPIHCENFLLAVLNFIEV